MRIGTNFTNIVNQMKDQFIKYVWFDFHHECRKMKWENLSKLINIVQEKLDGFDYFLCNLQQGFDHI